MKYSKVVTKILRIKKIFKFTHTHTHLSYLYFLSKHNKISYKKEFYEKIYKFIYR